jgi:hypothetical protein
MIDIGPLAAYAIGRLLFTVAAVVAAIAFGAGLFTGWWVF